MLTTIAYPKLYIIYLTINPLIIITIFNNIIIYLTHINFILLYYFIVFRDQQYIYILTIVTLFHHSL